MARKIEVKGSKITVLSKHGQDYISLTDMLKAKDGDFFISDWLRNRNTVEFLGIWEMVYNPNFNYGEFAIIIEFSIPHDKVPVRPELVEGHVRMGTELRQAQPERLAQLNAIAITQMRSLVGIHAVKRLGAKKLS